MERSSRSSSLSRIQKIADMPSDPISPPPVSGGGRFELPAYLSNGIVGLRVSEVALTGGIAMVSGFSGEDPVKQIEAAVQAPYPLAGDISINGVVMSATGHAVRPAVRATISAAAS